MSTGLNFTEVRKGYDKQQVEKYVSDYAANMNKAIQDRDAEIKRLAGELENCRRQLEQMSAQYNEINRQRDSIAAALVDAKAKAEEIVDTARADAEAEKERINAETDVKRQEIIERNRMIRDMKAEMKALFDDMKQNMNFSFDGIIRTLDGDMEKFSDVVIGLEDKYAEEELSKQLERLDRTAEKDAPAETVADEAEESVIPQTEPEPVIISRSEWYNPPKAVNRSFGAASLDVSRLVKCRESLGISKSEAARRINVSQPAYVRYEGGQREPSIQMIGEMAKVFGTTVEYLTGKTDDPRA